MTSPPVAKVRPRHAALDGFRGSLLILFMAYHFGVHELTGVWTLLSTFFTISGFLIARILLRQRIATGRIDFVGFYRRRAERLLPALFAMLVVVGLWATLFASDAVRRQLKGDTLATLGFVMNWRLIVTEDEYFGQFATASFYRHVWSLAVEEQFYVISPMLIALLVAVRSQRFRLVILLGGMVLSAVIAARIGVDGLEAQARVYYGTDTRVGAILAGIAMAFVTVGGWRPPRWLIVWGGPLMLFVYGAVVVVIEPMSAVMFEQTGLFWFSFATLILILVMIDDRPTPIQRLFEFPFFVWAGVRVYALYLYHWPVKLWLDRAFPDWSTPVYVVVGTLITLALGAVSYRYLEEPVLRGGVRALIPRLSGVATLTGAVAAIVALAFMIGHVPDERAGGREVMLVDGAEPYSPESTVTRVALYGDSVPNTMFGDFDPDKYSDLAIVNLAVNGCGLSEWSPQFFNAAPVPETDGCPESKLLFEQRLKEHDIDTVILQTGSFSMLPHWASDGSVIAADDPRLVEAHRTTLDSLHAQAMAAGVTTFVTVTVPCRSDGGREIPADKQAYRDAHPDVVADFANPVRFNEFLADWAAEHDSPVADLYAAMGCSETFDGTIHGVEMYQDMLHFSSEGARMVWTWLAPTLQNAIRGYDERDNE